MIETLFRYPRVLARHLAGPSVEARERFLDHCAHAGAARESLLHLASELLLVARRIDISGTTAIVRQEVEAAADGWVRHQRCHHRISDPRFCRQRFVQVATDWLRFLARLDATPEKPGANDDLVDEFADYMRLERGLSPHTIHNRCWHVQAFLHWLSEHGCSIAEVSLEQVDAFLAMRGVREDLPGRVHPAGHEHGRPVHGVEPQDVLADQVQARPVPGEALPVGPRWKDVQRLIASADTDSPQDLRDRAILLLLAVYGLRCGEVVALSLDDVCWEQEILHVSRPKQRCKQDYPLTADVGNALLRYLQHVRPRCASRSLFLTIKAPIRPLAPSSLHYLVTTRMQALDIRCPRRGPHALRHACAAHLVAEGLSLKQIGDHLGHRSPHATRTYAKVDLVGLRQVADRSAGTVRPGPEKVS